MPQISNWKHNSRESNKKIFDFEDQKYVILSLYSPRNDDFSFFEKVFDNNFTNDQVLISYVEDWNTSPDQLLDTSGYLHENNTQNQDFVKTMMTQMDLKDVWRMHN